MPPFLLALPIRFYLYLAGTLGLAGTMAYQHHQAKVLRADLKSATEALDVLRILGQAQIVRVADAEKRLADRDAITKRILKELGKTLPRTDAEARAWAIRASEEIGR